MIPQVRVTEIGEYIRHHSCERRFKLDFNKRAEARANPLFNRLFNAIDPVLQAIGRKREEEWEAYLREEGFTALVSAKAEAQEGNLWSDFIAMLPQIKQGQNAYMREVEIQAEIGSFDIIGRVDFLLIRWEDDTPYLWIIEAKSSRRDRTYHRVQITLYWMIVQRLVESNGASLRTADAAIPSTPGAIKCLVVRVDETTNRPQAFLELEPFSNLDREESDILRLVDQSGPLNRIIQTELSKLDYCLDQKCDGCVFNTNCLPESARLHSLELLGLDPPAIRILKNQHVNTVDDLATLQLDSRVAAEIRNQVGFTTRLDVLRQEARARRQNLPGTSTDDDEYPVMQLPYSAASQLPEHEISGDRLIRVYLNVDYDYIENRLVGLSAHITNSDGLVRTGSFYDQNAEWTGYDPRVMERYSDDSLSEVQGEDVIEMISDMWSGHYEEDVTAEKFLIQSFFRRLIIAIGRVASEPQVRLHFYVWSRSEMRHLIEACSRVDSRLLTRLQELLGCRESLDQMIYSCVQAEIMNRFALGWSGRGLVVAASLTWFGDRYHWNRTIGGRTVPLDQLFTQDIFDFKTDLYLNEDGTWASDSQRATATRHKFEIRSRHFDSLTAPYWYSYWNSDLLPSDKDVSAQVARALQRYKGATTNPAYLEEYLRARIHALRWLEEKVKFKNEEIDKPRIALSDLPNFDLGVETVAQSAIDFLRLDHHVKFTDWLARHLAPPSGRVANGETIPLRDISRLPSGDNSITIIGQIDLTKYGIDEASLGARLKLGEGSFVRLSPYSGDPNRGQTIAQHVRGGVTCRIEHIDWQSMAIRLTIFPQRRATRYLLASNGFYDYGDTLDFATVDEGIADFVAGTVEDRLLRAQNPSSYRWFDPVNPDIPALDPCDILDTSGFREFLSNLKLSNGRHLAESQANAILEGLNSRVQILQGPPGTGKTTTSSIAVLLRILQRCRIGDIVILGANTHPALDTLLAKIDEQLDGFADQVAGIGLSMPNIVLSKVHSSAHSLTPTGGRVIDFPSKPSKRQVSSLQRGAVLVIAGTTNALLKLDGELSGGRGFPNGLETNLLIVDEASMMVFPHFLALSSLVGGKGQIMLSGDHRQLSPIVAHDWEREDRPPVLIYQPYVSAYQAIDSLVENNPSVSPEGIYRSKLNYTFRLPSAIRELIGRIYKLDDIELDGMADLDHMTPIGAVDGVGWESIWRQGSGLFLVLHDERYSRQYNNLEVEIIEAILSASNSIPDGSVAIVTPYRAQRSLLQNRLSVGVGPIDIVDTVERLQGGERPTIIVSAVASDPFAISANAEFLLNLNRSNVAFSRSQDRLIVICSEELINFIPAELEHYESALLWKALRSICTALMAEIALEDTNVRILTIPIDH